MHLADMVLVTRAETYIVPNAQYVGRVSLVNKSPATLTTTPPRLAAAELGTIEVTWGIKAVADRIPCTFAQ
jgi:hypothetical protein